MLWRSRSGIQAVDSVQVGIEASGAPLSVPVARVSTLIAGLPGSGKSSTLAAVIAGLAPLPGVSVVILDPKRITFLHTLDRCIVATGLESCTAMLDDLGAVMDTRYQTLERARADLWTGSRIVVIVDELAELSATADRKGDQHRSVALRRLLQLGRAAGIVVIGATQRPSAALIDSDARALFGARIAHALDGPESVKMAGFDPETAPAHRIPLGAQHAGLAWLSIDGTRTPTYGRVWHADRELVERLCHRHAHLRLDPFHELTQVDTDAQPSETLAGAGLCSPWPAPIPEPSASTQAPYATVLTADDTAWHEIVDQLLAGRAPIAPTSSTTEANHRTAPVVDTRGQANVVSAPALREEPQAATDLDIVLEVLTNGPVPSAELPARTRLSEGRCRRARQNLERLDLIRLTDAGWVLR